MEAQYLETVRDLTVRLQSQAKTLELAPKNLKSFLRRKKVQRISKVLPLLWTIWNCRMDQNSPVQFLWILQMKNPVQVSALWIRGTLDPHPIWKTFPALLQRQIQGFPYLQNPVKELPSFAWCAVNDQKMQVLYMDAWDIRYVAILVQRNCGRNRQGALSVDGRWSGLSKSSKPRIRNHDRRLAPCIKIDGFCFWVDFSTAVCCMYVGQKGHRNSTEDAWFNNKRWRGPFKLSKPWIKNDDKRLDPYFDIVSFWFWFGFCNALAFIALSNHSGVQAGQNCFQNSVLKHHHILYIYQRKQTKNLVIYKFLHLYLLNEILLSNLYLL